MRKSKISAGEKQGRDGTQDPKEAPPGWPLRKKRPDQPPGLTFTPTASLPAVSAWELSASRQALVLA